MQSILIKVNGEESEVKPRNGTDFKLEELYELIGTNTIEVVFLRNNRLMITDEEGKLKPNATTNVRASNIYGHGYIAGNVIICDKKMFK